MKSSRFFPPNVAVSYRFWSRVRIVLGGNDCWDWRGPVNKHGYGKFLQFTTHRVAFALQMGLVPHGLCVCHICDNRRCVRPDHLFLGSSRDNTADKVRKGRQANARNARRLNSHSIGLGLFGKELSLNDLVMVRQRKPLIERLENKTLKTAGCWFWMGAKGPTGHGTIYDGVTMRGVHRVAYECASGLIPDGLHVLHACGTSSCVNPSHLKLGTAKDNHEDTKRMGRFSPPPKRWALCRSRA